jgi:hypothetical protein
VAASPASSRSSHQYRHPGLRDARSWRATTP